MKYVAFVTKGLETICEEELKTFKEVEIIDVQQKFIFFEYSGDVSSLKNLRTIDDIAIYISEIPVEKLMRLDIKEEIEKIKEGIDLIKGCS